MPKYAYIDPVTKALLGGGWHRVAPSSSVEVPEEFDVTRRNLQWDGNAWQPYTPPVIPPPTAAEQFDQLQKMVKAVAIALGTAPATAFPMTAAQIRARVVAAYDQLPD
jgi:hypothetical protein